MSQAIAEQGETGLAAGSTNLLPADAIASAVLPD
jgi:hypothetical protein